MLETAHSEEALIVARSHPGRIDVMVTDVVMPGFGGPELASRLAPLHPETNVLYISGYTEHDIAERACGTLQSTSSRSPSPRTSLDARLRR